MKNIAQISFCINLLIFSPLVIAQPHPSDKGSASTYVNDRMNEFFKERMAVSAVLNSCGEENLASKVFNKTMLESRGRALMSDTSENAKPLSNLPQQEKVEILVNRIVEMLAYQAGFSAGLGYVFRSVPENSEHWCNPTFFEFAAQYLESRMMNNRQGRNMKIFKLISFFLMSQCSIAPIAFAERPDGSSLLQACNQLINIENSISPEHINLTQAQICMQYARAIADTANFYTRISGEESNFSICIPPEVTTFQLARVIKKHFENSPEKLHTDRFLLVVSAYRNSFPCE